MNHGCPQALFSAPPRTALLGLLLALVCAGCGADPCLQADERLVACFGEAVAGSLTGSACDPDLAGEVSSRSCDELAALMDGSRAELKLGLATEEAIVRLAMAKVAERIPEFIGLALQSIMETLTASAYAAAGEEFAEIPVYIGFFQTADRQEAEAVRGRLQELLEGEEDMLPTVLTTTEGYEVISAPWPVNESEDWLARVQRLFREHPELYGLTDWSFTEHPDQKGYTITCRLLRMSDYTLYLNLFTAQDLATAEARAEEIGALLAHEEDISPRVILSTDDTYLVLQDACPINRRLDFRRRVRQLVQENPQLLFLMDWRWEVIPDTDQARVWPKVVQTSDKLPDLLGCQDR
jgi:hypothetical protein